MGEQLIIPVILAGGLGSRLWPVSKPDMPKPFLHLTNADYTMFQETILRASYAPGIDHYLFVGNAQHEELMRSQYRAVEQRPCTFLLEPIGRNTAAAIVLAALHIEATQPDACMWVMPADHAVKEQAALQQPLQDAVKAAALGRIATFGITPEYAATGYGYIKRGERQGDRTYCAAAFKEKPDDKTAEHYIATREYMWNSGMFIMQASTVLDQAACYCAELVQACRSVYRNASHQQDVVRFDHHAMQHIPAAPFDKAVMEHTELACVIPIECGWSDIGDFQALAGFHEQAALPWNTHERAEQQQKQYRPWGWWQVINQGPGFKVKRIQVMPGKRLSLQQHQHRAEHWVVVQGSAQVLRGDRSFTMRPHDSVMIQQGVKHRLANVGEEVLEVIEIQTGGILAEDDIIRLEDDYGRQTLT